MINGAPSPWKGLTVEQLKEVGERYKAINNITQQAAREAKIQKEAQAQQATEQVDAMKDRLPYLDTAQ